MCDQGSQLPDQGYQIFKNDIIKSKTSIRSVGALNSIPFCIMGLDKMMIGQDIR